MAFTCPDCNTTGAIKITSGIELSADARSDEIMLQVVRCDHCAFAGLAVYEESRRGPLDAEYFDHVGYRVAGTELAEVVEWIESCPEPTNHRCLCLAHRELNKKNDAGYWNGRAILARYDSFELEMT